jgi:hypothetical protein
MLPEVLMLFGVIMLLLHCKHVQLVILMLLRVLRWNSGTFFSSLEMATKLVVDSMINSKLELTLVEFIKVFATCPLHPARRCDILPIFHHRKLFSMQGRSNHYIFLNDIRRGDTYKPDSAHKKIRNSYEILYF